MGFFGLFGKLGILGMVGKLGVLGLKGKNLIIIIVIKYRNIISCINRGILNSWNKRG